MYNGDPKQHVMTNGSIAYTIQTADDIENLPYAYLVSMGKLYHTSSIEGIIFHWMQSGSPAISILGMSSHN